MRVHRSCSVLTHLGMAIVTSTTFEELMTTTTGIFQKRDSEWQVSVQKICQDRKTERNEKVTQRQYETTYFI